MFIHIKDSKYINFDRILKFAKCRESLDCICTNGRFGIVFTDSFDHKCEDYFIYFDSEQERDATFDRITKLLIPENKCTVHYPPPYATTFPQGTTWSCGTSVPATCKQEDYDIKI